MDGKPIAEGALLWEPTHEFKRAANMTSYMSWLGTRGGPSFAEYDDLWRWSVEHLEDFWTSLWRYLDIHASRPAREDRSIPSRARARQRLRGVGVEAGRSRLLPRVRHGVDRFKDYFVRVRLATEPIPAY